MTALNLTSLDLQTSASLRFTGTFISGALPENETTPLMVALPSFAGAAAADEVAGAAAVVVVAGFAVVGLAGAEPDAGLSSPQPTPRTREVRATAARDAS